MPHRTTRRPAPARAAPVTLLTVAVLVVAVLVVVLLSATGGGAWADDEHGGFDPLDPGPLFATIDGYEPESLRQAFTMYAYGRIAHLDVEAVPGHEIVVLGYDGEPFLKVDRDGVTWENDASSTAIAERASTAGGAGTVVGPPPPSVAAGGDPVWRRTGATHHLSWHDHRVHWMQATPPTTGPGSDVVAELTVQVVVDGQPGTVRGSLHRDPSVAWAEYGIAVAPPQPGDEIPPAALADPGRTAPLVAGGVVAVVVVGTATWLLVRRRGRRAGSAARGRA